MNDVKWIKIAPNIFSDEKMLAIESMPDGRDIQLAWFKILCLAGSVNQCGFLTIANKIACTDEMLASIFHMEIGVVQRALDVFVSLQMIEVVDNAYMVSNWNLYQNQDGLDEIREKNRERQRKHREKQKSLIEDKSNVTVTLQNNVTSSISISNSNNINNKYTSNFEEFWKAYPRHIDKSRANKCYQARIKDGWSENDLLLSAENYAKACKKDKTEQKYIKHPSTFLSADTPFTDYLKKGETNEAGMARHTDADAELDADRIRAMREGTSDDDFVSALFG